MKQSLLSRIDLCTIPDLIDIQRNSFQSLLTEGLIKELNSRKSITNLEKTIELTFYPEHYKLHPPEYTVEEAIKQGKTYSCRIYVPAQLIDKKTKQARTQWVFLGNLPLMTKRGHFILNGTPRVIINQLVRSPGIYYQESLDSKRRRTCYADLISQRGTWLRFEFDKKNRAWVRMKKTPKIPATILLQALGLTTTQILNKVSDKSWVYSSAKFSDSLKELLIQSEDFPRKPSALEKSSDSFPLDSTNYKFSSNTPNQIETTPSSELGLGSGLGSASRYQVNLKQSEEDNSLESKKVTKSSLNFKDFERTNWSSQDRALFSLALILYPKKDVSELSPELGKKFLFRKFLNPRTYDLGNLGRLRLNARFEHQTSKINRTLTPDDILNIFDGLAKLEKGLIKTDDIDHLKNRRVRASGELIQNQLSIGLLRLERVIRERLKRSTFINFKYSKLEKKSEGSSLQLLSQLDNSTSLEANSFKQDGSPSQKVKLDRTSDFQHNFTLKLLNIRKLVSSKPVNTSFREFFGSSQLSQFLDQTNPLAEITHKRRFTCLGPGGVNRDTAGMAVRSIHPSHYGRICPIETPEGQNAGLVNSPTIFANLSKTGFLLTPFYKVAIGQVQKNIINFSADKEEKLIIAPADLRKSVYSFLEPSSIPIRHKQDFGRLNSQKVSFLGVSPLQMISLATALVPFLEHDDANRALMGSNMQRQAVPLLTPSRPIVGTGLEGRAVMDSGSLLQSDMNGYVYSVSGKRIILIGKVEKPTLDKSDRNSTSPFITNENLQVKVYFLSEYHRSNQDTSLVHRPLVKEGQWVEIGDILADCSASINGDLALGKNLFVAYMPWEGYNFEDAILINERLVQDDLYTSLHIEKYTVEAKDTKYGFEQITRNLQDLPESALKNLAPNGIISEGTWVKEGDILVGKSTPITRKLLSPHEKLLYDVVGKQIPKTCDTSLRVPKGVQGRVLAVEILSPTGATLATNFTQTSSATDVGEEFTGLNVQDRQSRNKILTNSHLKENSLGRQVHSVGVPSDKQENQSFTKDEKQICDKYKFLNNKLIRNFSKLSDLQKTKKIKNQIPSILLNKNISKKFKFALNELLITNQKRLGGGSLKSHSLQAHSTTNLTIKNSQEPELNLNNTPVQITIYLAQKRKIQVGDKIAGRHGNKGIVSRILSREDMPYLPDGTPIDIVLNPLGVPSRMNVGQVFECLLGLAGFYLKEQYRILSFDEMFGSETSRGIVYQKLYEARKKTKQPWLFNPNHPGKLKLFDGRTGEPFDQPVMVGQAYMLKLVHLVDDKIHARSTGPYSLVTQQPLRGRSKHGGQRLGEMEVWALEGFGAAYTLQELLTVKSDDIKGRHQVMDAILNNEAIDFATPESFKVLVRELQSLCLDIGCYGLTTTGRVELVDMKQLDLAISRFEENT